MTIISPYPFLLPSSDLNNLERFQSSNSYFFYEFRTTANYHDFDLHPPHLPHNNYKLYSVFYSSHCIKHYNSWQVGQNDTNTPPQRQLVSISLLLEDIQAYTLGSQTPPNFLPPTGPSNILLWVAGLRTTLAHPRARFLYR